MNNRSKAFFLFIGLLPSITYTADQPREKKASTVRCPTPRAKRRHALSPQLPTNSDDTVRILFAQKVGREKWDVENANRKGLTHPVNF